MKKRLFVGLIVLAVCSMAVAPPALAHVLIMDDTGTKGAILHITPDDNPIAGEPAALYLDIQDGAKSSANLTVEDTNGTAETVEARVDGSLAVFAYTFPAQGVYRLTFRVGMDAQAYSFSHTQRVSRGITASALQPPRYVWAEAVLFTSGVGIVVLGTIIFNRRKSIAAQSTF